MQFLALSKDFICYFILQIGELWRKHLLPSHCSSGFSRAGMYLFDPRAVTKEKLLILTSSPTCSTSQVVILIRPVVVPVVLLVLRRVMLFHRRVSFQI